MSKFKSRVDADLIRLEKICMYADSVSGMLALGIVKPLTSAKWKTEFDAYFKSNPCKCCDHSVNKYCTTSTQPLTSAI